LVAGSANVVPSSPILVTLIMKALHSSETSVLTRATQRNIPEDVLHLILQFFILIIIALVYVLRTMTVASTLNPPGLLVTDIQIPIYTFLIIYGNNLVNAVLQHTT
jgi:hypothetical protein